MSTWRQKPTTQEKHKQLDGTNDGRTTKCLHVADPEGLPRCNPYAGHWQVLAGRKEVRTFYILLASQNVNNVAQFVDVARHRSVAQGDNNIL